VPYHYGHYDPNQLSGGYRVLRLLTRALICHNFKLWVVCSVVSTVSYEFCLRGVDVYHLVVFS
jgi:hypothetical protein